MSQHNIHIDAGIMMENKHLKGAEKYLTYDEVLEAIERCASTEQRALFAVLFLTGCRVSEALLIRRENIKLEDHPKLGKTLTIQSIVLKRVRRKRRTPEEIAANMPLNPKPPALPPVRESLIPLRAEGTIARYIFQYVKGMQPDQKLFPIHRTTAFRWCTRYGFIKPHGFHHSRATYYKKKGIDIQQLKILMGWASLTTAEMYSHIGLDDTLEKLYG